MRLTPLALLLALLTAAPAVGQSLTACDGGFAEGYPCSGIDLFERLPLFTFGASDGNDIWGWADPQDGSEYALVGLSNGTAFVDVTDPSDPVYLGLLPSATSSSTWRDVKTIGNYAYIVSEASGHGMQVFDLTRLRDVQSPPTFFTADARFGGFGSAHNIVANDESHYVYAVGQNACAGGLYIVDVSDPLSPQPAGCYDGDGYTHDAQCLTYDGPDTDYAGRDICMASNEDHLAIIDVTDPGAPVLISRGFYPSPGYTHQGWFTEDRRHFLMNDELDEIFGSAANTRTIVMDVEDLDDPEFDFFYFGPLQTSDHNLYIRGQFAFLSNYTGGLRIVDLSDIDNDNLVEVASFDTFPSNNADGFDGQWSNYPFLPSGNLLANDGDTGFFVLKASELALPAEPEAPGPQGYALGAPSPNPFTYGTTLQLTVAETQSVRAEVFDVSGRRVAVLHDGLVAVGSPLALRLDADALPAGLYLVRVTGEDFTASRRASLVR
ncbi:MAG: choice-of-anchor B family protein [Rubricoccaceae bacterium]|nr:choice-of-anchor B family protein [Rubricoccaceae bacterium]